VPRPPSVIPRTARSADPGSTPPPGSPDDSAPARWPPDRCASGEAEGCTILPSQTTPLFVLPLTARPLSASPDGAQHRSGVHPAAWITGDSAPERWTPDRCASGEAEGCVGPVPPGHPSVRVPPVPDPFPGTGPDLRRYGRGRRPRHRRGGRLQPTPAAADGGSRRGRFPSARVNGSHVAPAPFAL